MIQWYLALHAAALLWPSIQFVYMSIAVIIRFHSVFCRYSLEIARRSGAVFNLPRFLCNHADIGECFSGIQPTEHRDSKAHYILRGFSQLIGADTLHRFVPILTCMLSTYASSIPVLLLQISVVPLQFKAGRNRQCTIAPTLLSNFIEESAP
jgi:hypothetical protein